jgi:hypothetical protein
MRSGTRTPATRLLASRPVLRGPARRWLVGVAVALLAGEAAAQGPDLNWLALQWTRGRFFAPLVCHVDGGPQRTIRRLVIRPSPRPVKPAVNHVTFLPIEVESATRCSDVLGTPQPDLRGRLEIHLPGHSRPDLAQSEFRRTLRNEDGFEFEIREGRLQVTPWEGERRVLDLAGGRARIRPVRPRTDAARVLAEFEGARKLVLEIEGADGASWTFHLVQYDDR